MNILELAGDYMNCPRCGEKLFGSVCPRCGNIVTTNNSRQTPARRTVAPRTTKNDNIRFMDGKGTKPVRPSAKRKSGGNQLYKLIIVILAVICVFFFIKYSSASSKLKEAEATITSQDESIKSKDEEIAQLKTTAASQTTAASGEDGESSDDDSPSVEFDENGNLIKITDNGSSDSSDSSDSDSSTEYKSGDVYTVQDGDTGSTICKAIYGEYTPELWEKILSANDMTTSTQYYPGDELKVP